MSGLRHTVKIDKVHGLTVYGTTTYERQVVISWLTIDRQDFIDRERDSLVTAAQRCDIVSHLEMHVK